MNRAVLTSLVLCVACGGASDMEEPTFQVPTVTSTEGGCEVVAETPLALDEQSEAGFTADQALMNFEGLNVQIVTYPSASTIDVSFNVLYEGAEVVYRERELFGAPSADVVARCISAVEFDVAVTMVTGDGSFDESWGMTLQAITRDVAVIFQEFDSLNGNWMPEMSDLDATLDPASLTYEFDSEVATDGLLGEMNAFDADGVKYDVVTWEPSMTMGR